MVAKLQASQTYSEPGNTAIHKRIQGITDAILSLAYQGADTNNSQKSGLQDIINSLGLIQTAIENKTVPAPNVYNINISVYILLINLNIFIWWWLCRNKQDRIGCLIKQMGQSKLWTEAIEGYSRKNELEKLVPAIFETPVEFMGLRAESLGEPTPEEEEEREQKWMDCASKLQDLCLDMLGSFTVESPDTRQQAAPPSPPPEPFSSSEVLEEQLTEEILAQALPLLHELSKVEASLTDENLDVSDLDRLEKQLQALQTKLAEHTDLFDEELAISASEPLQDNTLAVRYQRLSELQQLRQLILQYFASK
jgi:hypothetical protein